MSTTADIQAATNGLLEAAAKIDGGTPCKRNPSPYQSEADYAVRIAKKLCGACPLLAECRDIGFTYKLDGVWGGMDEEDREHHNRSQAAAATRRRYLEKRNAAQHTLDDELFGLAS